MGQTQKDKHQRFPHICRMNIDIDTNEEERDQGLGKCRKQMMDGRVCASKIHDLHVRKFHNETHRFVARVYARNKRTKAQQDGSAGR